MEKGLFRHPGQDRVFGERSSVGVWSETAVRENGLHGHHLPGPLWHPAGREAGSSIHVKAVISGICFMEGSLAFWLWISPCQLGAGRPGGSSQERCLQSKQNVPECPKAHLTFAAFPTVTSPFSPSPLLPFFFPLSAQFVGSYFPNQGLNPGSQQWNRRVLTSGLPGTFLGFLVLNICFRKLKCSWCTLYRLQLYSRIHSIKGYTPFMIIMKYWNPALLQREKVASLRCHCPCLLIEAATRWRVLTLSLPELLRTVAPLGVSAHGCHMLPLDGVSWTAHSQLLPISSAHMRAWLPPASPDLIYKTQAQR